MPSEPGAPAPAPPDYEGALREARERNINKLLSQLSPGKKNKALEEKIGRFCEGFGFSPEEVKAAILRCRVTAAKFAIDPGRQSLYEKLAGDYIGDLPGVTDLRKPTGRKALWVVEGEIIPYRDIRARKKQGIDPPTRSIDFEWRFGGCHFYASHKHTRGHGSAQGGSREELKRFLEEGRNAQDKNTFFVAIADGSHYEGRATNREAATWLDVLRETASEGAGTAIACSIDRLHAEMKRVVAADAPAPADGGGG